MDLYSWYFDWVLGLDSIDACSVISEGMLEMLDNRFSIRSRVPTVTWGSGFDDTIFVPIPDRSGIRQMLQLGSGFTLMFHGSLSPTRELDRVVHAIDHLRKLGEDGIDLVFIGRGRAKAYLTELAGQLCVGDRIRFVPPIAHTEIPKWIAAADLGLDPLPDHPWWRHQSPLKVYEYLAMGKPVLATDIPCHRDISEAVRLVPDNRPSTLAEAILRIKESSQEERRILSETAIRDAQQYTWQARAKVLADFLYEEVLAG
jgi:glycosyltransferase involved in cell wall biosynthesis